MTFQLFGFLQCVFNFQVRCFFTFESPYFPTRGKMYSLIHNLLNLPRRTFFASRDSHLPEGPVNFGLNCAYELTCMYTKGCPVKVRNSISQDPDQPQRNRPAVYDVAQQVSFRNFASLRFHAPTERFGSCFKSAASFFAFLKLRKSKIVSVDTA